MFANLKKFDVHVKALEGVNQQTLGGAFLTILCTVLVVGLLFSEISLFKEINVVSRLEVDKGAGVEAVKLMFDVSFQHIACERITFFQEATRGTVHAHEPMEMTKVPVRGSSATEGCRVSGWGIIDKIAGNFRFAVNADGSTADMSHTVNYVSFLPTVGRSAVDKIPEASSNISDLRVLLEPSTAIYQYSLQVIPTQFKELWGEVSHMNQYSLSEKALSAEQAKRGDPFFPVPVHDFSGVLFTYDFHPVMLYMEEHRERIIDFVCNLCGIIGGVITILGYPLPCI